MRLIRGALHRSCAALAVTVLVLGAAGCGQTVDGQRTEHDRLQPAAAAPPAAPPDAPPGAPGAMPAAAPRSAPAPAAAAAVPTLRVRTVVGNLDIPWDVAVLPTGEWLITERDRQRILLRTGAGAIRVIARRPAGMWSSGETGLMGILGDPNFAKNRRFYTCHGFVVGGRPEVRVVAWRTNLAHTAAWQVDVLVGAIPATTGRHGGCRLRFGPEGALYVGTGDGVIGTNPQNLRSLGGKILRLNRFTGNAWSTNPFIRADRRVTRLIFTYGHRNTQGLSVRPGRGMWSVEHGTSRDDEVNRLQPGGNYGWDPGPSYDESTPMTDFSLPGRQIPARWRSGAPTIATSGATWVRGAMWGGYQGTLAVATLKESQLVFMRFDSRGRFQRLWVPPALNERFGRLRTVVQAPNGSLLITTSNGDGTDRILRVAPG